MKHVFIVNPAAGKRDMTAYITGGVAKILGDSAEVVVTTGPGHATRAARSAVAEGGEVRLYSCGGDGTANEVLTGMFGCDNAQLAVVPIGSGNDFVKMYNTTADLHTIIGASDSAVRCVDVMEVNGRLALNIVSAGFDAGIAASMQKYKKLPLVGGDMAYTISLAINFFSTINYEFGFVVDGEELPRDKYLFGVVTNGRYYGGGYMPVPEASITDGYIELMRIKKIPRTRMLSLIGDYKIGAHVKQTDVVDIKRCRSVQYLSDKPMTVTIDGEMAAMENPLVKILPGALKLVMP